MYFIDANGAYLYIKSTDGNTFTTLNDLQSQSLVNDSVSFTVVNDVYSGLPIPFSDFFSLDDVPTTFYAIFISPYGNDFFEVLGTGVEVGLVDTDPRIDDTTNEPSSYTATLPDGKYIGQQITLTCSNTSGNRSSVSVTGTGLPSLESSSTDGETLHVLVWDGSEWKQLTLT